MKQQDLFEAKAARDEALHSVSVNAGDWMSQALFEIAVNLKNESWRHSFIGEDLRLWLERRIGPPHHHNAYGALMRMAGTRGLIEMTGQWKHMRTRKSHARQSPVYRAKS